MQCPTKPINTYSPKSNCVEGAINENKKLTCKAHDKNIIPGVLLDYTNQYYTLLRLYMALDIPSMQNKVPETILTGEMAGISYLVTFEYWKIIKFLDRTDFLHSK